MRKHFVSVCGVWVNPWQVCYVREGWDNGECKGSLIGFHGGCAVEQTYVDELQTNELFVEMQPEEVVAKLEAAMQEGGAE